MKARTPCAEESQELGALQLSHCSSGRPRSGGQFLENYGNETKSPLTLAFLFEDESRRTS
ncbi:conserved hypothetical protein [Ricinus communis]|uniref:Uncharacterized protein n=1 Tax=Ricinus communis TaxID=3988 RepID=B9TE93_RICCO|nr:conserved hypothetical protein [Ricinus communis]EEF25821.1 conserved hypothetical protein [Ricinus communis]